MRELAITIKDIARDTNLSIATISKYINGIKVSDENAHIIEESIKKNNYRVNTVARGLKTNKTKSIGVVVPDLTDIYSSTVIKWFEKYVSKKGYSILVCDCQSRGSIMVKKIDMLISKMVDGLLLFPILDDQQLIEKIKELTIPIITVDQKIENVVADFIATDGYHISNIVGNHFIELKHINPSIITGPVFNFTSTQRLNGFVDAYCEHGIDIDKNNIIYTDFTAQGGYNALVDLWSKPIKPTAVFTTNYHTTLGVVMAANDLSLQIPNDFSLFGYDNFELSRVVHPSLSMVIQPIEKIGKTLSELFLKRLKGDMSSYPTKIILKSQLVFGETLIMNNNNK